MPNRREIVNLLQHVCIFTLLEQIVNATQFRAPYNLDIPDIIDGWVFNAQKKVVQLTDSDAGHHLQRNCG